MGFDGKSCINPKQIGVTHEVFNPTVQEIAHAEHILEAVQNSKDNGVGVLTVDGKMVDIAWVEGSQRTLKLAKAAGIYKGALV
ncbi:hypothetical protein [Secundilactobacillus collinoides]|nr:hypothetical protein [Secundilactobacillus collinoides]